MEKQVVYTVKQRNEKNYTFLTKADCLGYLQGVIEDNGEKYPILYRLERYSTPYYQARGSLELMASLPQASEVEDYKSGKERLHSVIYKIGTEKIRVIQSILLT